MAYNKSDLVAKIAQKTSLTKAQSEAAINAFQEVLVESLESGEGLRLTGVLSASRVKRAARTGRNPRTGETIKIPAGYGAPGMRPGLSAFSVAIQPPMLPQPHIQIHHGGHSHAKEASGHHLSVRSCAYQASA